MKTKDGSGWMVAALVMFVASLIGLVHGVCTMIIRPAGDISLRYGCWLAVASLVGCFLFGIILSNLTMTEEEGRLPDPPPKTENGSCGEDSGRHC